MKTGFKPWISGVGINRSTNCATTISQLRKYFIELDLQRHILNTLKTVYPYARLTNNLNTKPRDTNHNCTLFPRAQCDKIITLIAINDGSIKYSNFVIVSFEVQLPDEAQEKTALRPLA